MTEQQFKTQVRITLIEMGYDPGMIEQAVDVLWREGATDPEKAAREYAIGWDLGTNCS